MRPVTVFRVLFLLALAVVCDVLQSFPTVWPKVAAVAAFGLLGGWQAFRLLGSRRRAVLTILGVLALHSGLALVSRWTLSRDSFLHASGNCDAPLASPIVAVVAKAHEDLETLQRTWEDTCRVTKLGAALHDRPERICGASTRVACFRDLAEAMNREAPLSDVGHMLMIAASVVVVTKDAAEGIETKVAPELAVTLGASVDVLDLTFQQVRFLAASHRTSSLAHLYRRATGKTFAQTAQGMLTDISRDVAKNLDKEEPKAPEIVQGLRPRFETLRREISSLFTH